ncbi:hypothetical protein ACFPU0_25250 [Pseudomonas sp. GCM10022186]|uniref:hypothetical protein n=1 Tax=Pseudomonas sp. GCM10022186 TaxID=3252650 RepID=UPI0036214321
MNASESMPIIGAVRTAHPTADLCRVRCAHRSFVGWVERSDTHHFRPTSSMGIALLHPSYDRPCARLETAA